MAITTSVGFKNMLQSKKDDSSRIDQWYMYSLLDKSKPRNYTKFFIGALADPPVLYGWLYPNLLMVLMILLIYSTVYLYLISYLLYILLDSLILFS
jgi:hypothetical protein